MSYFRRGGMSDAEGPITSPSQVDDEIPGGIIAPTRVSCDALPADSPWRKPGQACAPPDTSIADFFRGILDKISTITSPTEPPPTAPSPTPVSSSGPSLLALAAIGGVGYYLYKKRKRRV